jgi:metal-responsive CopG/Arc/MetJ family transcriptional regulator
MSGFKKSENAKPLITFTVDEELLKRIEDFQFDNRIKNRSQAITQLVLKGMEEMLKEEKK